MVRLKTMRILVFFLGLGFCVNSLIQQFEFPPLYQPGGRGAAFFRALWSHSREGDDEWAMMMCFLAAA
jgi:hypothetical protein